MEFTDIDKLLNYLGKNIRISLQEVGKEVEKLIQEYILENWYNKNEVNEYVRTYNFLNSLRVKKVKELTKNNYSIELYFDTNAIIPNYVKDSFWNQHRSLSGEDVSEAIPMWIEQGNNPNGKHPVYEYKGIHVMENMSKEELKILQILWEKLKNKGFDCVLKG